MEQLVHEAAEGPHVDAQVVPRAREHLGRHVLGRAAQRVAVGAVRAAARPAAAAARRRRGRAAYGRAAAVAPRDLGILEAAEPRVALGVDEDRLRAQVAVHDRLARQVLEGHEQARGVELPVVLRQPADAAPRPLGREQLPQAAPGRELVQRVDLLAVVVRAAQPEDGGVLPADRERTHLQGMMGRVRPRDDGKGPGMVGGRVKGK